MTITPRQARFVEEYLCDLNATQAAVRAGYAEKTAESQASRLLRNVKVAAAVQEGQATRSRRTLITADRVLEELARVGFSDALLHYEVDEAGHLTLSPDAPVGSSAALSSIKRKVRTFTNQDDETETTIETEFRLWDKVSALDKLGKHLGLFVDRVDLTSGEKAISFTLKIGEADVADD